MRHSLTAIALLAVMAISAMAKDEKKAQQPERPAFYEGLIRVLDQTGRVIPAVEFIEAIETTEIGREIDCLALKFGLETLAAVPGLRLSINMSVYQQVCPATSPSYQQVCLLTSLSTNK